jgi:peptidoglycan/LPS O-acetylase OafA/YrhL
MLNEKNRIDVLDFLRGIASLAVVWHHFFGVLDPGWLRSASHYGQLGVQVFFVISGFIIPYSLYRGEYTLRNYGTFVIKRVTRLDPPYLVTLVIIVVLGVLSWYFPFQKGLVFEATVPQVLLHLAYVNVFFGYPWLTDIFWTLAIEFQYYLLMGLVFPLVFSRSARVRILSMAALGALAFVIPNPAFIFYFIFLFFMGVLTCQYRIGMIGRKQYALSLAVVTLCALASMGSATAAAGDATITPLTLSWWTARVSESAPATIAGFATVCAILFLRMRYAVFHFLGSISYSLYLIHSPVGRRALNVFLRFTGAESQGAKLFVILLATGVSIFAAYLLYRWVERPSQQWSQSFRYHRRRARGEVRPEELEQLNPAL